jgi:hypothetical protein
MRRPLVTFAAIVFAGALIGADDKPDFRSGPQVDDSVLHTFDVRNCNGADAGDTNCQV